MILLATALTTYPQDIYESASIDGATRIQRFFYITVPLLRPAIISVLTLGFIYTFKVFDLVYVMTGVDLDLPRRYVVHSWLTAIPSVNITSRERLWPTFCL